MENPTYIALSRQAALRRELEVVAHNIANMNTPAYKAERMVFREFLIEQDAQGAEDLSFTQDVGLARDLREGTKVSTGNDLDLSLSGDGYFVVDTAAGERYTRHGRFQLDARRQLVTGEGDPVMAVGDDPIIVPAESGKIEIAGDGTITTAGAALGKIKVVAFEDPYELKREPNSLYNSEANGRAIDRPTIIQGMLEQSNVHGVLELTRLIEIQREHQSVQHMLNRENERQQKAIDRIAKQRGA